MKVKLFGYDKSTKEFDIGDVEDIHFAFIEIISGDEVLTVHYKDGTSRVFDGAPSHRCMDYADWNYPVYGPGVNLFEDQSWLSRPDSDY